MTADEFDNLIDTPITVEEYRNLIDDTEMFLSSYSVMIMSDMREQLDTQREHFKRQKLIAKEELLHRPKTKQKVFSQPNLR